MLPTADPKRVTIAAAERLFRSYERHCVQSDEDALFVLLNSLHSLGDKLSRLGRPNLNTSQNFLVLKALRNLYHHQAELLHDSRSIQAGDIIDIQSDLGLLCLVPTASIDLILERSRDDAERAAIESILHWYGPAVNIEPAIFNGMVDVYELLQNKGIVADGAAFVRFDEQYRFETSEGHAHRITGILHVRAGDMASLLSSLLAKPTQ